MLLDELNDKKNDGIIWQFNGRSMVAKCIAIRMYLFWTSGIHCLPWPLKVIILSLKLLLQILSLMAPYFHCSLFLLPAPIAFFTVQEEEQLSYDVLCVKRQEKYLTAKSPKLIEFESYIGEYFKSQGYAVKQSFHSKT
ncbi:hypothetical protein OK016_16390 [Vibrio chagasii]|nr:hypothetical protein [Vibrio chagasii]